MYVSRDLSRTCKIVKWKPVHPSQPAISTHRDNMERQPTQ